MTSKSTFSACSFQSLGKEGRLQLLEWPHGTRERPADHQLYPNLCRVLQSAGVHQRRSCVQYPQRGLGWDNRIRYPVILVRRNFYVCSGLG